MSEGLTTPGRTVAELAERWATTEAKAVEWLRVFERLGLARELRAGCWAPTEKALRETRIRGFTDEAARR